MRVGKRRMRMLEVIEHPHSRVAGQSDGLSVACSDATTRDQRRGAECERDERGDEQTARIRTRTRQGATRVGRRVVCRAAGT